MRLFVPRNCLPVLLMVCLRMWAEPAPPPPLSSIAAIRALSPAEANKGLPVRVEGVVTYDNVHELTMFLQDGNDAIYVVPGKAYAIAPGARVEVVGKTSASYTNEIDSTSIRVLGRGTWPKPLPLDYEQAVRHENDCRYVSMTGIVRAASFQTTHGSQAYLLELDVDGRPVEAVVPEYRNFHPNQLLDATVRVTGALGGAFDVQGQIVELQVNIVNSSAVEILRPAPSDPVEARAMPLAALFRSNETLKVRHRIFTTGIVTLYDPGELLVIQQGNDRLLVRTRQMDPVSIGQRVEVTGFFADLDGSPGLDLGQFFVLSGGSPVAPHRISFADAMTGEYGDALVTLEGEVVSQTRERHLDTVVLRSGDHVFQAVLRKRVEDRDPMPTYQSGTRIQVTGVCTVHIRGFWGSVESFQIHLRSPDDMTVVAAAPWWTLRHLFFVTSALFGFTLVALSWGLRMRRRLLIHEKLLRQNSEAEAVRLSTLARLERQRSHILELVNSFQPLSVVLTAIQAYADEMWAGSIGYSHVLADRKLILVGRSRLSAEDAARLETVDPSNRPEACAEAVRTRRLVGTGDPTNTWSRPILSSRGEILGTMTFAGKRGSLLPMNSEAFEFGCNLAAIAIDNRRLYEDVLHRSEHDQLTGLANRTLVESRLGEALQQALTSQRFAALLYLDLDHFKAVNDSYTHRVGDSYLIEVSQRFKACLRDCDTLGRVGGDEFVAVLADLSDAGAARSIAERLVQAMRTPIVVERNVIHGSVSVGLAVFPSSGSNAEELTHLADNAMYVAKRAGGNQACCSDAEAISAV